MVKTKPVKKKNGVKKTKAIVKKQNQFRTEYKDRISNVISADLGDNTGSALNGPENSIVIVPPALTTSFL